MSELATIILAAGNGTRMKSDLPKVMHKVANKPMLWHVLRAAEAAGSVKNVVIVQDGHEAVKKLALGFANTEIAVQKQQRGTGDAVKAAEEALADFDGKVIILNGDCPLVGFLGEELTNFCTLPSPISILGFETEDNFGYGRLVIQNGKVQQIVEEKDATPEQKAIEACNSGIYAVDAKVLFELLGEVNDNNSQGEYYLTDIIKIAGDKKIEVGYQLAADESLVLGVNNKIQLAQAEEIIQEELTNQALENGVTLISPAETFLSADTKFGLDVVIKPFTYIAENVEIGNGVEIGPFAHLRPGTKLDDGAKIGNFVEVKNSSIGKGSKVNHLSYIGDSEVARGANIGAGVITCNYDGFNKHKTEIGDGAFIGSNSALVAPVKIGANAIVAAGSTITGNVDADALAISRAQQKNLASGAVRVKNKLNKQ